MSDLPDKLPISQQIHHHHHNQQQQQQQQRSNLLSEQSKRSILQLRTAGIDPILAFPSSVFSTSTTNTSKSIQNPQSWTPYNQRSTSSKTEYCMQENIPCLSQIPTYQSNIYASSLTIGQQQQQKQPQKNRSSIHVHNKLISSLSYKKNTQESSNHTSQNSSYSSNSTISNASSRPSTQTSYRRRRFTELNSSYAADSNQHQQQQQQRATPSNQSMYQFSEPIEETASIIIKESEFSKHESTQQSNSQLNFNNHTKNQLIPSIISSKIISQSEHSQQHVKLSELTVEIQNLHHKNHHSNPEDKQETIELLSEISNTKDLISTQTQITQRSSISNANSLHTHSISISEQSEESTHSNWTTTAANSEKQTRTSKFRSTTDSGYSEQSNHSEEITYQPNVLHTHQDVLNETKQTSIDNSYDATANSRNQQSRSVTSTSLMNRGAAASGTTTYPRKKSELAAANIKKQNNSCVFPINVNSYESTSLNETSYSSSTSQSSVASSVVIPVPSTTTSLQSTASRFQKSKQIRYSEPKNVISILGSNGGQKQLIIEALKNKLSINPENETVVKATNEYQEADNNLQIQGNQVCSSTTSSLKFRQNLQQFQTPVKGRDLSESSSKHTSISLWGSERQNTSTSDANLYDYMTPNKREAQNAAMYTTTTTNYDGFGPFCVTPNISMQTKAANQKIQQCLSENKSNAINSSCNNNNNNRMISGGTEENRKSFCKSIVCFTQTARGKYSFHKLNKQKRELSNISNVIQNAIFDPSPDFNIIQTPLKNSSASKANTNSSPYPSYANNSNQQQSSNSKKNARDNQLQSKSRIYEDSTQNNHHVNGQQIQNENDSPDFNHMRKYYQQKYGLKLEQIESEHQQNNENDANQRYHKMNSFHTPQKRFNLNIHHSHGKSKNISYQFEEHLDPESHKPLQPWEDKEMI